LEPPDRIRDNPAKLQKWKPAVKSCIDWEGLRSAEGDYVGKPIGDAITSKKVEDGTYETDQEPEFLTIGLIGM
jgi:hypothetical protein